MLSIVYATMRFSHVVQLWLGEKKRKVYTGRRHNRFGPQMQVQGVAVTEEPLLPKDRKTPGFGPVK